MDTTTAFEGLECIDCGARADAATATHRCPDCGGALDPTYDYDAVDLDRETLASRRFDSLWRYEELLPFTRASAVTMNEGATPLVDCPSLADELDLERVCYKDDGRNPTGTAADRGQTVAATAARQHDATDVALASTGNGGQSAAAYAGRAGLESHVFVPARSGFTNKAMINVHGGDMSVVGGRYDEAVAAAREALEEHDDWYSLQSFATPYRHEGAKTAFFEIVEQLDWEVPDAVVVPTGSGLELVGLAKAAREFERLGLVDERPSLYAAQTAGCAPLVDALEAGADDHLPVETPDTICGALEVPDPEEGAWLLAELREVDGGGVATEDEDVLEAAVRLASHEGLEPSPSTAAAASGLWQLVDDRVLDGGTVVVYGTTTANKEADVLRSHLMSQGV